MKPPVLTSKRLRLRPVDVADAPAIQRHFGTWAVIRHLSTGVPWPYPSDGAIRFVEDRLLPGQAAGESLFWGITLLDDPCDEVVGAIEYRYAESAEGNRGFWLAEHLWGQGLMSEAVVLVQDHLFFEVKIERMVVVNSIHNPGSRRVKEKTGAIYLGECEVPHHEGGSAAERWEVTLESWVAARADAP